MEMKLLLPAVPLNSKELLSIHLVEEFTRPQIHLTVSSMKIDGREVDGAVDAQGDSHAECLTGSLKSVLVNPVLPSEFDRVARASARKRKWEFANSHPVPFRKAWKGFRTLHPIKPV
jgi:hypothetical protein